MNLRHVRPSSLTLIAILAFVFAGFSILTALGQGFVVLAMSSDGTVSIDGETPSLSYAITAFVWSIIATALLTIGGIGLLRVSSLMGRWTLTAWAVIDLAITTVWLLTEPTVRNSGVSSLMGSILPILTLLWVHGICRDVWSPPHIAKESAGVSDSALSTPSPIWLSTVQSLRQSLRAIGGPGFLMTWLIIALLALGFIANISTLTDRPEQRAFSQWARSSMTNVTRWAVSKLTGENLDFMTEVGLKPNLDTSFDLTENPKPVPSHAQTWTTWLLTDHRPEQSFSWLLLSILVPFVVSMTTCGAIARDIANRGFRFLLVRADRRSVFWGRFLAPVILVWAANLSVAAIGGLGFYVANPVNPGTTVAWAAWAGVALCVTSLPYMALGLLCSTLIGNSFGSLATYKGILAGVLIMATSLAALWSPLIHLIHLLPLVPQLYLFHPHPGIVAVAVLICLVYTAIFLWLAQCHFQRRDL